MELDIVASKLSGAALERYKQKCARYPWYSEAQRLMFEWNEKTKSMTEAGEDPNSLYEDRQRLPVRDIIRFAALVYEHKEILRFFEDFVARQRTDPDAEFDPDWLEIFEPFSAWFFLRDGIPPQQHSLVASRGIVLKYLRGELTEINGEEAQKYALTVFGVKQ